MSDILVVKESRQGEKRVALTPNDAQRVARLGHHVVVEAGAGEGVGFADSAYLLAGAEVRSSGRALSELFKGIDIVLRVKRAERDREIAEATAISPGTMMIGFLDPLDPTTPHVTEWKTRKIRGISLDHLQLNPDDPMNVLSAMSALAGSLALEQAVRLSKRPLTKTLVVLGMGSAGKSAALAGIAKGFVVKAIGKGERCPDLEAKGVEYETIPSAQDEQIAFVREKLKDADIVIASARSQGQPAPLLVDGETLTKMQEGAVIVDLARTEGGNVEGSQNDATVHLGNGVIVTNNTGYPKLAPLEASQAYSRGLVSVIEKIAQGHFKLQDPLFKDAVIC